MLPYRLKAFKFWTSIIGILYIWNLPNLSFIGFAESNSKSVSAFIANPPATGAMAAVSFMPMTLMWQYQNIIIYKEYKDTSINNIVTTSLCTYQVCFSLFLICTDGYVPGWLHFTTVVLFCLSFFVHAGCIVYYFNPSNYTKIIFGIGSSSLVVLLIIVVFQLQDKGMWFYIMECIGLTCMFLFTPLEWYSILNKNVVDT